MTIYLPGNKPTALKELIPYYDITLPGRNTKRGKNIPGKLILNNKKSTIVSNRFICLFSTVLTGGSTRSGLAYYCRSMTTKLLPGI
jgi:hypothetical protein